MKITDQMVFAWDKNFCGCKDYEENIKKINAITDASFLLEFRYRGKSFEYCPFCGKKLEEIKKG